MNRKIYLILVMIIGFTFNVQADESNNLSPNKIEPGIYVFVSFSMNDQSLRNYFYEAQNLGGKLVMIGLSGDKNGRNRFGEMRARVEKAKINVDINPTLFEQLNIKQVPVIAVVSKTGSVKKVAGHISLKAALEIMQEERKPLNITK